MPKYQAYPEYKDSGVEWLNDIPDHWEIKKLKFLANVIPSNVDKKTKNGEISITLCNYTDVYYNDTVDSSIDFMKASATVEQVEKFTLQSGDTIITKDSEDPNDIAIPTFVPYKINGTVCGYHLSIIRPNIVEFGAYIKRVFECGYARAYFSTSANGLTRYGLGTYPLNNIYFPMPSTEEAKNIANFLDHETAKIDTLIEKQQQLIQLLKEKRQAVISHAVTKGLNPDAPMKDSGVEWLGEVAKHWDICRIKHICAQEKNSIVDGPFGSSVNTETDYVNEGIPVIRTINITNNGFSSENLKFMRKEKFEQLKRHAVYPGDVLFSKVGTIGNSCVLPQSVHEAILSTTGSCKITVDSEKCVSLFLVLCIHSMHKELMKIANANVQPFLNMVNIKNLYIPLPSINEQNQILNMLSVELKRLDTVINKACTSSELLQERRTALISAAVTGKIDVRSWQPAHTKTTTDNKSREMSDV